MVKDKIKRNIIILITVVVVFSTIFICMGRSLSNDNFVPKDYWIATHYFADSWPKNFWDSEFTNIDSDFQRMKDDGFNCIVLLIPWREFQPVIEDEIIYNDNAFEKLDMIMEKAEEYDLGVILRLGYFWDYYNNESMEELYNRYWNILGDDMYRKAWLDYSEKVYNQASMHENLLGGFICWEDFWGNVKRVQSIAGKNETSYEVASYLKYDDYIKQKYSDNEINIIYDENMHNFSKLYIPSTKTFGFESFYDFYDQWLNDLLNETQEVFPKLSMEVRVDDDLTVNSEGENVYYSHKKTYSCEGADYATIVYGIPMGFENKGEKVHWDEALHMTANILNKVSRSAQYKKLFIDQFLFYDNTQEFSYNAQIVNDEIDDYLLNCVDVLLDYSNGYGVWTYKDYYFDAIANGEFAKGLDGWEFSSDVKINNTNESNKCLLDSGQYIKQNVAGKVETVSSTITCSFEAEPLEKDAMLTFSLGGKENQVVVDKKGNYVIEFADTNWDELKIVTDSKVYLDNIKLYNFCQEGLLYDANWSEEKYISSIREMNSLFFEKICEREEKGIFYDMIEEFGNAEIDGLIETTDYPIGRNVGISINSNNRRQIFTVPETSIKYAVSLDGKVRSFHMEYMLQEDAASWNISDGAEIVIEIINQDGAVVELYEAERIKKNGKKQFLDINLKPYVNQDIFIVIKCYENEQKNCDADWVAISDAYIN